MTRTPSWRFVAVAAVLLTALNFVRLLPATHGLSTYVFGDPGLALSVDAMLDEGKQPTVDFAYFYGLLGIALNRGWFAVLGRTAEANTAALAVSCFFIAIGCIRFGRAVQLPPTARWLLLAGIPVAVMPLTYTSPAHGYEAALLVNALAFQARGRYAPAFMLAVIGVFVKSALVSVYAAGLPGLIVFAPRPEPTGWRTRLRELIPGALVGGAVAAVLASWFGWEPLVKTLFPTAGAKTYADEQFGFFFGIGRRFWLHPSLSPAYYLLGPAGFWLAATGVMLAGVPGLLREWRNPAAVAILTCAALHVVFVCLLFGNELSWLYYSFLPVLGVCGVVGRWAATAGEPGTATTGFWFPPHPNPPPPGGRGPEMDGPPLLTSPPVGEVAAQPRVGGAAILLIILALCGWVLPAGYGLMLWGGNIRSAETGGLFASPDTTTAWADIRDRARHERVLVVSPSGAGRVLFLEIDSVRSSALLKAVAPEVEVNDLLARIRAADMILIHPETQSIFETWSTFAAELRAFAPAAECSGFRVYRRAGDRVPGE